MVTDGISRWFEGVKELFPESMDEDMLIEDLEMTLNELNELVYDFHERKGVDIGCTMSLMVLVGQNFYVFHVGDSRIYQVGETAFQITKDEVVMVESGGRIKSLLANFVGKAPKLWMNRFTSRVEGQTGFLNSSHPRTWSSGSDRSKTIPRLRKPAGIFWTWFLREGRGTMFPVSSFMC